MRKYKDFKQLAESQVDKRTRGYIQTVEDLSKACRRERNLKDPQGIKVGISNLKTTLEKRRRNITNINQEQQLSVLLNALARIETTLEERLSSTV